MTKRIEYTSNEQHAHLLAQLESDHGHINKREGCTFTFQDGHMVKLSMACGFNHRLGRVT